MQKPWYTSKMIWVNVIAGLIAVIEAVVNLPFVTPDVMQVLTIILTIANVILRLVTFAPVTDHAAIKAREEGR